MPGLQVAKSEVSSRWHIGKRNVCVCNSQTGWSVKTDCWVVVAWLLDDRNFSSTPQWAPRVTTRQQDRYMAVTLPRNRFPLALRSVSSGDVRSGLREQGLRARRPAHGIQLVIFTCWQKRRSQPSVTVMSLLTCFCIPTSKWIFFCSDFVTYDNNFFFFF